METLLQDVRTRTEGGGEGRGGEAEKGEEEKQRDSGASV